MIILVTIVDTKNILRYCVELNCLVKPKKKKLKIQQREHSGSVKLLWPIVTQNWIVIMRTKNKLKFGLLWISACFLNLDYFEWQLNTISMVNFYLLQMINNNLETLIINYDYIENFK